MAKKKTPPPLQKPPAWSCHNTENGAIALAEKSKSAKSASLPRKNIKVSDTLHSNHFRHENMV
jgi:hypothetical protein